MPRNSTYHSNSELLHTTSPLISGFKTLPFDNPCSSWPGPHTPRTTRSYLSSSRMSVSTDSGFEPFLILAFQATPVALAINNTRASIPNIMITNSGSQRFDIYAGSFTKNDQLTASPFADAFLFIPNVTFSVANQVLPTLNNAGANERRAMMEAREHELYGRGYVDTVYSKWLEEMDKKNDGMARRAAQNLTLGYVTTDVR